MPYPKGKYALMNHWRSEMIQKQAFTPFNVILLRSLFFLLFLFHAVPPAWPETITDQIPGAAILDAGTTDAPSEWTISQGVILQKKNIWGGSDTREDPVKPGTALIWGQKEWTDYTLTLDMKSQDDDAFGFFLRHQDENTYYRVSLDKQRKVSRLIKKSGGFVSILSEKEEGYVNDTWYRMKAEIQGSRIKVFIDNRPLFDVSDTDISSGKTGLYCWGNANTHFKNVTVMDPAGTLLFALKEEKRETPPITKGQIPALPETPRSPQAPLIPPLKNAVDIDISDCEVIDEGKNDGPSSWYAFDGVLSQGSNIWGGAAGPDDKDKPGTFALVGKTDWSDHTLSVEFRSQDDGASGVMFRYKDKNNYYRFSMDHKNRYRRLIKKENGRVSVLAEESESYRPGQWNTIKIQAVKESISIFLNDALVFSATDASLKSGKAALYCWGNESAEFRSVKVASMAEISGEGEQQPADAKQVKALPETTGKKKEVVPPEKKSTLETPPVKKMEPPAVSKTPEAVAPISKEPSPAKQSSIEKPVPVKATPAAPPVLTAAPLIPIPGKMSQPIPAIKPQGTAPQPAPVAPNPRPTGQPDLPLKEPPLLVPASKKEAAPDTINDTLKKSAFPIDLKDPVIVDEGSTDAPSFWYVKENTLIQTSNIWGGTVSANSPEKPGTMALFGEKSWNNYIVSLKLSSQDDDELGVVFRYQDQANYYRISMNRQLGYIRLIKKVKGKTTIIDQKKHLYEKNRWYRLRISVNGNKIALHLDNLLIFDRADPSVPSGRVGFYCWGNENSEFADILIIPLPSTTPTSAPPALARKPEPAGGMIKTPIVNLEEFSIVDDGKKNGPSHWSSANGVITQTTNVWGGEISPDDPAQPGTYAVWGDAAMRNYEYALELKSGDDDSIGVLFRYQDEKNHYRFSMNSQQKKWRLAKKVDGKVTILAENNEGYEKERWYQVDVRVRNDHLTLSVEGLQVFDIRDSSLGAGKIALYCWGNQSSSFRNISIIESMEERMLKEKRITEEKQLQEEALKAEQIRRVEALKQQEEARIVEAKRLVQQQKIEEEIRKADEEKRAARMKQIQAMKQAEMERQAVEERQAEAKRLSEEEQRRKIAIQRAEEERQARMEMERAAIKRAEEKKKAALLKGEALKKADIVIPVEVPSQKIKETLSESQKSKYIIVDEGTKNGPSSWSETKEGMIQHSNIWGGEAIREDMAKPGTYVIWGEAWKDHVIEAKIRSLDDDEIGVMFRYRDNNNYYRFSMNSKFKYRRLIKKVAGKITLLANDDLSYRPGASYAIKIKAIGKHIELYVDNSLVFSVSDMDHPQGKIGLYAWANDHSEFTDLSVLPLSSDASASQKSNYQTMDEGNREGPSLWLAENGVLFQRSRIWGGEPRERLLKKGTYAIWGESFINQIIETTIQSGDTGSIGIMFRYKDTANYYLFEMNREFNYQRLIKNKDGKGSLLAEAPFTYDTSRWYKIKIVALKDNISVFMDGRALFDVKDSAINYGKICFYSWKNRGSAFKDVSVVPVQSQSDESPSEDRSAYQIIDEGEKEGPSRWGKKNGKLTQSANIWGGAPAREDYEKPGTSLVWNQGGANYTFEADLLSHDNDDIGILLRFKDKNTYYRFSMSQQQSYRRLVRKVAGRTTLLAEDAIPYVRGKWHSLKAILFENRIVIKMDGETVFDVLDNAISDGKAGFYTWENDGAEFDNIEFTPLDRSPFVSRGHPPGEKPIQIDMTHPTVIDEGAYNGPSSWAASNNSLIQKSNIWGGSLSGESPDKQGTLAIFGEASWADSILRVALRSGDDDEIGVVFRYRDPKNHYRFSMNREKGYRRLIKRVNGEYQILFDDKVPYAPNTWYNLRIDAINDDIRVYVDTQMIASVKDPSLKRGRIGLYCWANKDSEFKDLSVESLDNKKFGRLSEFPIDPLFLFADASNESPPGISKASFKKRRPKKKEYKGYTIMDQGRNDGPSSWSIAHDGSLLQKSNIYGDEDPENPVQPGTYALKSNLSLKNFKFSCELRSQDDDAMGIMFRYVNPNNYYRFSMNRQQKHRTLSKIVNGRCTVLAEDFTPYIQDQWYQLTISAMDDTLEVYLDGMLILDAIDDTLSQGQIGFYCWGNEYTEFRTPHLSPLTEISHTGASTESSPPLSTPPTLLPAQTVATVPEFSRIAHKSYLIVDEGIKNEPSSWSVIDGILKQSSNIWGGSLEGPDPDKPGTYVLWGDDFENYTVTGEMKSGDDDALGVMFRYQDANNYYRFSMNREMMYRELVKKVNGVYSILHKDPIAYEQNRWHSFQVTAINDRIALWIDGKQFCDIRDTSIKKGKAGLYCWGNEKSEFDNFMITPYSARGAAKGGNSPTKLSPYHIDIDNYSVVDEGENSGPSSWSAANGVLTQKSNIWGGDIDRSRPEKPGTFALYGNYSWRNYGVSLDLRSEDDDAIGLMVRYQDRDNYYRISLNHQEKSRRIIKKVKGKTTILAEDAITYTPTIWFKIKVICIEDKIIFYQDGTLIFTIKDTDLKTGKFGLYCWGNEGGAFKNIVASPIQERSGATLSPVETDSASDILDGYMAEAPCPFPVNTTKTPGRILLSPTKNNRPDALLATDNGKTLKSLDPVSALEEQGAMEGFDDAEKPAPPPGGSSKKGISFSVLFDVNGYLRLSEAFNFAHTTPENGKTDWQGLSRLRAETGLEVAARTNGRFKGLFTGKGFYDFAYDINGREKYTKELLDLCESDAELNEAYIQGELFHGIDLKIGRQVVVWGKSENIRVTDLLNPLDIQEPGLTDIKYLRLPVFMCRLDYLKIPWTYTLISIHENRFNRIPAYGSDFYPYDMPPPGQEKPDEPEFAFSLNGSFPGMDLSFYAASVFDDTGYITLDPSGLVTRQKRISMGGAAINRALGNFLVKIEAAFFEGVRYTNSNRTHSKTSILAGVEYSGFKHMTTCFEMANERIDDFDNRLKAFPDEAAENRLLTVARLSKNFMNDALTLSLYAQAYDGDFQGGAVERFMAEYDWSDAIRSSASLLLYQSGKTPLFQSAGDNDRLYFDIKYSF